MRSQRACHTDCSNRCNPSAPASAVFVDITSIYASCSMNISFPSIGVFQRQGGNSLVSMPQFGRRIRNGLGRVYCAGMSFPGQFNLLTRIGKKGPAHDSDVLSSLRNRLWRGSNQSLSGLAQAVLFLVTFLING